MTRTFVVEKRDLRRSHWLDAPAAALDAGQVRLRIDRFALTSNNITYGAFGETMGYWKFFPTGDAATGCIPVWGFADVVESRAEGIEPGSRFYGYWPMADEAVLGPVRVNAQGFVDGAAHRRELHGIYNQYVRTTTDPLHAPGQEDLMALLRPLFMTSFLIDDFLADNGFFGATNVIVSSASSKTSYGLGFCLEMRKTDGNLLKTMGLTSNGNVSFVRALGCFDEVVAYDDVAAMSSDSPAIYVDMSGSASLRSLVHDHWGDRLVYSCSVGGTHWQDLGSAKGLQGPRPTLFFAPAQAKKRVTEWGAAVLQQRLATAWHAFIDTVAAPKAPWLHVVSSRGRDAVAGTYATLLAGNVQANEGHVL
ncbi:MAG: DUF2855 family protein, partial [Caldimonas sp.]